MLLQIYIGNFSSDNLAKLNWALDYKSSVVKTESNEMKERETTKQLQDSQYHCADWLVV